MSKTSNLSLTRQLALILGVAAAATLLTVWLHPKRPAWYRVSSAEDARWRIGLEEAAALAAEKNVLWVDARDRPRYEAGHLEGAILLTPVEWGELMFEHMDRLQEAMSGPVVVYDDGSESGAAKTDVSRRLRELLGLDPVYALEGDWRELAAP